MSQSTTPSVTFDLSGGAQWGRAVYSSGEAKDGLLPVTGCLTPLPKVGDTVLDTYGDVWEFADVKYWGNPRDGFQGHIRRKS
jgi:hypothetical protein